MNQLIYTDCLSKQKYGFGQVKFLILKLLLQKIDIELVHTLGVSVEIELKMDWHGCKQV